MANENLKTLEDKLSYAYDTKVAIKDAIEAKGVEVPEGTVFRDYAGKIGEIETGGQGDIEPVYYEYLGDSLESGSGFRKSYSYTIKFPEKTFSRVIVCYNYNSGLNYGCTTFDKYGLRVSGDVAFAKESLSDTRFTIKANTNDLATQAKNGIAIFY